MRFFCSLNLISSHLQSWPCSSMWGRPRRVVHTCSQVFAGTTELLTCSFLTYEHYIYVCLFTQTCLFPDTPWKSLIGMFLSVLYFLWYYKWDIIFYFFCSIAKSYPTLWDAMDYSLPGSSAHGIFQARILEWIAIFLLQEIFPDQGLNHHLLCLLHWQVGSLLLVPPNRYCQTDFQSDWANVHSHQPCMSSS